MPKTKSQKQEMMQNLEDLFNKTKSVVLIDYFGLKVKEINQLRRLLKDVGCQYLVAKKTLLKRTLDKLGKGVEELDKFVGGIGVIFGISDEVSPAKISVQFNKDHEKMRIHGGILEGKLIDAQMVRNLAKLPSREQLTAQLVWTIKSPLSGLANVLQGNIRNLVYALEAIKSKKS